MGSLASRVLKLIAPKRKFRVMLVGLDGAGKTTLMYRVFVNKTLTTVPTIGSNIETMEHDNAVLTIWDFGGSEQCRTLWRDFLTQQFQIIVFVVDATAKHRLDEAKVAIHHVLSDPKVRDCRVLIFSNKQDQSNALDDNTISEALALSQLPQRRWQIQGCSAVNGSGLHEGLSWCIKQGC